MGSLGPTEIILIILVVVLLFGAKKLPELARGSGRALRIFKSETSGLIDGKDGDDDKAEAGRDRDDARPAPRQELPRDSGTRAGETPEESLRRLQRDDNA